MLYLLDCLLQSHRLGRRDVPAGVVAGVGRRDSELTSALVPVLFFAAKHDHTIATEVLLAVGVDPAVVNWVGLR